MDMDFSLLSAMNAAMQSNETVTAPGCFSYVQRNKTMFFDGLSKF